MTTDSLDLLWRLSTIGAYQPLSDAAGWSQCPRCKQHPRTWVFDNGNFAKCHCSEVYGPAEAEAPSILEFCHDQGRPFDEYKVLLKNAWNARCAAIQAHKLEAAPSGREAEDGDWRPLPAARFGGGEVE